MDLIYKFYEFNQDFEKMEKNKTYLKILRKRQLLFFPKPLREPNEKPRLTIACMDILTKKDYTIVETK